MLPDRYRKFYDSLRSEIPAARLVTDPLRVFAYGTDASFYRLVPKIVVRAENEREVATILSAAGACGVPVTFRAGGTSLSGQAISDSVLVLAGFGWKDHEILNNGERIRLQPGVIGGHANVHLAPYGRKIGPDPASINAAMIGGIAANNASGMCCGTFQNSYQTISSMRIVFTDGSVLDTADEGSRRRFTERHPSLVKGIAALRKKVMEKTALADRIRKKFAIKNTTGYSLNALVDFEDPVDIILHLMIGSEGTLGFMSEIVYDTVIEHPHKASALMIFPDTVTAAGAVPFLKESPVSAVELMDRASLRSVENMAGMPPYLRELPQGATALLVETRAEETEELKGNMHAVESSLAKIETLLPIRFTDREQEYARYWNIRKGLFPAVGGVRPVGTSVIIEDIAFPIESLAAGTDALHGLLEKHAYHDAIIFGHALEGNLHFIFTPDFRISHEVESYRIFMDEICEMVVGKYDGSLKAEHGTGRNMAPFVEMEWGQEAFTLMKEIKALFDPENLLNPGVIITDNPNAHIENLKHLPEASDIVDQCTECGFCEINCVSRELTLSPRQRITAQREIARLKESGENPGKLREMEEAYAYYGDQTCAVDGLCATSCPLSINTGELTKLLRQRNMAGWKYQKRASFLAENFGLVTSGVQIGLKAVSAVSSVVGVKTMEHLSKSASVLTRGSLPEWNRYMPRAVDGKVPENIRPAYADRVVYFPSCISQVMGPAAGDPDGEPLFAVTARLLEKARYGVIFPEGAGKLCCGTPWDSKGLKTQADIKLKELERALLAASENGRYPVLCDTSPCVYRMRAGMDDRLRIYEPVEFIHDFLMDRLIFTKTGEAVAIHNTCSLTKMGLTAKFTAVAGKCAKEVVVPADVGCCGFAGDRGFTTPELNAVALKALSSQVKGRCSEGFSNSRTCEIGLSLHGGIYYKSIVYLVDRVTNPL